MGKHIKPTTLSQIKRKKHYFKSKKFFNELNYKLARYLDMNELTDEQIYMVDFRFSWENIDFTLPQFKRLVDSYEGFCNTRMSIEAILFLCDFFKIDIKLYQL